MSPGDSRGNSRFNLEFSWVTAGSCGNHGGCPWGCPRIPVGYSGRRWMPVWIFVVSVVVVGAVGDRGCRWVSPLEPAEKRGDSRERTWMPMGFPTGNLEIPGDAAEDSGMIPAGNHGRPWEPWGLSIINCRGFLWVPDFLARARGDSRGKLLVLRIVPVVHVGSLFPLGMV